MCRRRIERDHDALLRLTGDGDVLRDGQKAVIRDFDSNHPTRHERDHSPGGVGDQWCAGDDDPGAGDGPIVGSNIDLKAGLLCGEKRREREQYCGETHSPQYFTRSGFPGLQRLQVDWSTKLL
jgi:hypothetical protein